MGLSPYNVKQGQPYQVPVENVAASGAIHSTSGVVAITKATAAALTLASPPKNNDGAILYIVSTTAAAHTVTITAGFNGVGAGGDVGTFTGNIGDGICLIAYNGIWYVMPGTNLNVAIA